MSDFLETLLDFFTTIWDSIVTTYENFIAFCEQIANGYAFMATAINSLPAFCYGALMTILCISMVTMLISFLIDVA